MSEPANRARRDLTVVAALTVAFALLSIKLNLSESLVRWTHAREWLQLDELPQVLLVLAALLAWFALRRARELKAELARRSAAEARLASALHEIRRLGTQAVELQEAERRSLAREMHDEMGQYLVAIRMDATEIRNGAAPAADQLPAAAVRIIEHVEHVQSVVRDIIGRLRPAGLDELGLAAALEACVGEWRRRLPGVDIELSIEGSVDDLGEELSLALYRLTQESLTNASRHSAANRIRIAIERGRDSDPAARIAFSVEDDGRGAAMPVVGRGFGLAGMGERVRSLGGEFRVDSSPGGGFRVQAWMPREAGQGRGITCS